MRTCVMTLLTLACIGGPALGQPADDRIARLIASLDATQFAQRDQATRELLALEGAAIEPLREALKTKRSLEFTRRVQTILDALAIHEPGGPVVDGLKVRLIVEGAPAKVGDKARLVTILCNMTDKPLNVMVGYTTCGNYFECGSALRRVAPAKGKDGEIEAKLLVGGFCGTGAGPIYVTLPAKTAVPFETPTKLMHRAPGGATLALGKHEYFGIDTAPDSDRVRMVLTVTKGDNTPRPVRPGLKGEGIRPTDEDARFWVGVVRSNEVRLQIAP